MSMPRGTAVWAHKKLRGLPYPFRAVVWARDEDRGCYLLQPVSDLYGKAGFQIVSFFFYEEELTLVSAVDLLGELSID